MQLNSSGSSVHRYNNTKPMIKNKLKKLLSGLNKFKVQTILVLQYKKRNDHKIFHSRTKLIASDSDNEEAFKFRHQSGMTKTKDYVCEDWIVLHVIIKHSIKNFECQYKQNSQHKKWR